MGCDIHLYVEHLPQGADRWVSLDTWTKDKYNEGELTVEYDDRLFTDRNYELFAILAGVRNRFGLVPIAEPRGIPTDADPRYIAEAENYGGHSFTWLTLKELYQFDWTQKVTMSGVTESHEFVDWCSWLRRENESPKSYSQGVGGARVKTLTLAQGDQILADTRDMSPNLFQIDDPTRCQQFFLKAACSLGFADESDSLYVQTEWTTPYSESAGRWWGVVMPHLFHLAEKHCAGDHARLRVTFFFDN